MNGPHFKKVGCKRQGVGVEAVACRKGIYGAEFYMGEVRTCLKVKGKEPLNLIEEVQEELEGTKPEYGQRRALEVTSCLHFL